MFSLVLQDCLRLFSKEERLTDNNKVFCRHCKAHRDSTKKLEIWKVPPIVLVHLKRSGMTLLKKNCLVVGKPLMRFRAETVEH